MWRPTPAPRLLEDEEARRVAEFYLLIEKFFSKKRQLSGTLFF